MLIKGLLDEDFINYKKSSMFIIFPNCSMKCDRENGTQLCQNGSLMKQCAMEIDTASIVARYVSNPITHAIVCGGLEPFDTYDDLLELVRQFRAITQDDIVIYTGYNRDEVEEHIAELQQFKNIIVKFGRFRPNQKPHFDTVLGVNLASDNQHAEQIS